VERWRSERLPSEPESSSEFVVLVEEDRGCQPAPEFDASDASGAHPTSTGGTFVAGRWRR